MTRPAWQAGEAAAQRAVEAWLEGGPGSVVETLVDHDRRHVLHIADPDGGGGLLVKRFRLGRGRRRLRERAKRVVGRSPEQSEWRALVALKDAGVGVPAPLALGRLPGGDAVVATCFVESRPLAAVLDAPHPERRRLLRALGRHVGALHAAGWVHRDLHAGNILVEDGTPLLIDLQRARPATDWPSRARDLGILDSSLAAMLSRSDRVRLLESYFRANPPALGEARARLDVEAASAAWSQRHARSRARHATAPGPRRLRVASAEGNGMRVDSLSETTLAAAVRAHRGALAGADGEVLDRDTRSTVTRVRPGASAWVVKEVAAGGPLRGLWERLRGSAARRAWQAGHGLAALGIRCATPVAYLDVRRGGAITSSLLVMEDLSASPAADAAQGPTPDERAGALVALLLALHRHGVWHRDLKAGNVRLTSTRSGGVAAALLDLQDVRFVRRLDDERRRRGLVQLNASIPDAILPAASRRLALERYAGALPFRADRDAVRARVIRESLARGHRWTGADCAETARAVSR